MSSHKYHIPCKYLSASTRWKKSQREQHCEQTQNWAISGIQTAAASGQKNIVILTRQRHPVSLYAPTKEFTIKWFYPNNTYNPI